jgi:MFS transporter, DHA2 family, methylenomycin A resistance protein
LGSLTYSVIEGPASGWLTASVLGTGATAIIAVVAILSRRARWRSRCSSEADGRSTPRWRSNSIGWCLNFGFLVLLLAFTLYLEKTEGRSAIVTGLYLLPLTGMMGIGNILSGRMIARFGWRLPVGCGMCLAGLMSLTFAVRVEASYVGSAAMLAVIGLGVSLAAPGITASVLAGACDADGVTAAAQLTVSRQIGGTLGTAMVGSLIGAPSVLGLALALRLSIAVGGIAWLAGALLAIGSGVRRSGT